MSEIPVPAREHRVRIALDPEVGAILRPPASSRWSVAATLQLLQLAAILIGGGWALYLYVTFQDENNRLALEAARASLRQAQQTLKASDLAIAKETMDVDRIAQSPLGTTDVVSIQTLPSVPGWYLARYDFSITNNGGGRIDIATAIGDAFVGSATLANADGIVVNDVGDPGAVTWKKVAFEGHASRSAFKDGMLVEDGGDRVPAVKGGGGTGALNTTETAQSTMTVLVHANPTDFIGFRVRFTAVDSKGQARHHRLRNYQLVATATKEKERKPS